MTKIIATLGPNTSTKIKITELVQAGVNIFRLNLSHNTPEWHSNIIKLARTVAPNIAILADIPGRKIRTTNDISEKFFTTDDTVYFYQDIQYVKHIECEFKYQVNSNILFNLVGVGDIFYADDGTLSFKVLDINSNLLTAAPFQEGALKACKGINVPNSSYGNSTLTDKDKWFLDFCMTNGVDFAGISFVDSADYINNLKHYIGSKHLKLISKIESSSAINNLESIIEASYGLMIDRGDLSVETSIPIVGILQKRILEVARLNGKPVIVATETLHSMHKSLTPTKAEVNDVTNSTLDYASSLMLSGETAIGKYPIETVSTMKNIINAASKYLNEKQDAKNTFNSMLSNISESQPDLMAAGLEVITRSTLIKNIILLSKSGDGARYLSKYMNKPIIAFTETIENARSLSIYRNITAYHLDQNFENDSLHLKAAAKKLINLGYEEDSLSAFIYVANGGKGLRLNTIQVNFLSQLSQIDSYK